MGGEWVWIKEDKVESQTDREPICLEGFASMELTVAADVETGTVV